MAKRKVSKRAKKETNVNKNTNKNKNVINIKIHNNSKKKRSKSKSGQSKPTGQIAPYSSFNPTIYIPMPNYQQQMVGSGFRDAVNPIQNTRVDMQIPEALANPQEALANPQELYNPYSAPIYSTPIAEKSALSISTRSIPDDETVSDYGTYSSMASFPYSHPSALYKTEKFNIDNANNNMSEASFPIYSVFDKSPFTEEKSDNQYTIYEQYKNPMLNVLNEDRKAKDDKKINDINKAYYNSMAMEELLRVIPDSINNVKLKLTKEGIPKMNSKYGKQFKEIRNKLINQDK